MKCKQHPSYAANRMPTKTMKNPDGCPTCLHIWESKKVDPRGQLQTVKIELSMEDARYLLMTLKSLDSVGAAMWATELRTFRTVLMHAIKEVM